jgi:beta-fructofuranosidase
MLGYKPQGMEMWDAWCIEHEGELHMIHLQFLSANSMRSKEEASSLGHAVSNNLIDWEEMPLALKPGASGGLDDLQAWTGCIYRHEDVFYLYYTMRSSLNDAKEQHIGLATSKDLNNWQKYAGNPVISPDPKWYVHKVQPLPNGVVDCRDLVIVDNPKGKGWYGFYAARTPSSKLTDGSVIALVYSADLISWKHLPPAFEPKKYACIEVPDVFFLDGRWYMTCLTGNGYGNRGIFNDKHVTHGTIYAVADSIEGPYYEFPDDHLLIAGDISTGYSCRSFMFQEKRYALYTERGTNTLSPPMELCTTEEGYLRFKYCDRISLWRRSTIIEAGQLPVISGLPYCHQIWRLAGGTWIIDAGAYKGDSIDGGWQVADLGIGCANIEIEATIEIMSGKAGGLVWRGNSPHIDCSDNLIIMLDADEKVVQATHAPHFPQGWTRNWEIIPGKAYHLRIVVRQPRVEVYIDDHLALQFAGTFAESVQPSVGLFVDRAAVKIDNLAAYELS